MNSSPRSDELTFYKRLQPVPVEGGFRMPGYWVWCGSAIQGEDGRYHLFASRWSQEFPMFSGYILHSEIVHAVADTPSGPYTFVEKILPCTAADAWDGRMAHNPTIRKQGDTYLLYYIASTYSRPDGAADTEEMCEESYANIRIGLATARSVNGPWEVRSEPVLDVRPGKWDHAIVTNPAPVIRPDGGVLLYYRANTPEGLAIGVAGADSYKGPYRRLSDEPVLHFENGDFVEDPFVWWSGDRYEMLAKDMLGGLTGELHAGVHMISPDGLEWQLADSPKAYSRDIAYADGSRMRLGSLERPQLLFDENNQPVCLFAAAADGPGGFYEAKHTWNIAIPISD
ncbi:glycoside hydrolase family protein [Ruficoccus sp. ZRK36]|uniref:glycoside hydrolase family protein n=1 Tax=Ruficoccus sp. ZRK36 TaxID=2866311 RepID=UPI001C739DC8|nr:glycoside hydrolase family protein [Ruficoccus sp. ZRK36]QYY35068.1 glycoside hydrolase family protein [Ruficoccus sp. ZRK36]